VSRARRVSIQWDKPGPGRGPAFGELQREVRARLRALGIDRLDAAPSDEAWQQFVIWASGYIGELKGLERDVDLASDVQHSFVPNFGVLKRDDLDLSSLYRPAGTFSGDWWNLYDLTDGRMLLVIGDVTGHGVAPALLTGVAKGACDVLVRKAPPGQLDCASLLSDLNESICSAGTQELHMTCAVAILDPTSHKVQFASASHPLPYVVSDGEPEATLKQLVATGTPLGSVPDAQYQAGELALGDGDLILWYTDGLIEYRNKSEEEFGERRLRQLLRTVGPIGTMPLRDIVWASLAEFAENTEPVDDITLVIVRMKRP